VGAQGAPAVGAQGHTGGGGRRCAPAVGDAGARRRLGTQGRAGGWVHRGSLAVGDAGARRRWGRRGAAASREVGARREGVGGRWREGARPAAEVVASLVDFAGGGRRLGHSG
jgi:hypothetical protein